MTTYNISELTVTRAKLNVFPKQYPSHAPFTKEEVEGAKVIEVHFSKDLYAVVGTYEDDTQGVMAHRLNKNGTLNKAKDSTFFFFSQIVAIYCENISENNDSPKSERMNIIVEKVREIKGGVLKDLESKLKQITEIAKDFGFTNLKVHDISYYLYEAVEKGLLSNSEASDLFNFITEREYEFFQEWESENLQHVKRDYIRRTSSFYYKANFDNCLFDEAFEGKVTHLTIENLSDDLDNSTHRLLFSEHPTSEMEKIISEYDEEEGCFDSYLDESLGGEIEILEELSDDLDSLLVAVLEAKKAYDYLAEYKTKEHEYSIAKHYLEYEISEYYAENKAEEIFDGITSEHTPLNKITSFSVEKVLFDSKDTNYGFKLISNLKETTVSLELKNHELSEHLMKCILDELTELIDNSFDF